MNKLALGVFLLTLSGCVEFAPEGIPLGSSTEPGAPGPDSPVLPACATNPAYQLNALTGQFYRFYDQREPWVTAVAMCEADQAHLVMIDSDTENTVVVDIARDCEGRQPIFNECDTWLGLTRVATPDEFIWLDGARPGYTNWESNKPDNSGGGQDCVELNESSRWDDDTCSEGKRFVCECDVLR